MNGYIKAKSIPLRIGAKELTKDSLANICPTEFITSDSNCSYKYISGFQIERTNSYKKTTMTIGELL